MAKDLTKLVTEQELAERLGVSKRTLQEWRKNGSGPQFYTVNKKFIRYAEADIAAWLKKQKERSA